MTITLLKNQSLKVDIHDSFRNKEWGNDFGNLQRAIHEGNYGGVAFNQIVVDISACTWIDPLPLLSLLISLRQFKASQGEATLVVSRISSNLKSETDKVIKFLSEEGFLEELALCCKIIDKKGATICDIGDTGELANFILECKNIKTTLYYTNSTLLKAEILDCTKEFGSDSESVDSWVDEKLRKIRSKIMDLVPVYSQATIIYRMNNILVEAIQNIVKHAYTHSIEAFAGVYIRYRNGKENIHLSIEELSNIEKGLQGEERSCPKLKREFLDLRDGCIEIFIIDSGIGFTESLKSMLNNKRAKYAFRESFREVFIEGKRRKYQTIADRTKNGGLFLLGEMLRSHQDYLCGRDENEWIGTFFPFESDKNFYETSTDPDREPVKGLSWIFRLSWRSETENNKKDWTFWTGVPKKHPGYVTLFFGSEVNALRYPILDQRFSLASLESELQKFRQNLDDSIYFYLPSSYQTKYKLLQTLSKISNALLPSDVRTLIIADIPEFEKRTYTYILHDIEISPSTRESWISRFSKIVLVSKRLSISILERTGGTFKIAHEDHRETYFDKVSPAFSPDTSIGDFIAWIKAYDSTLYWLNVKNNNRQKQFFVNNSIRWNDSLETIDGFLNFAQTSTDSLCLYIYKNCIERCIGFFDFDIEQNIRYCFLKELDPLTSRLVDEFNSIFFNSIDKRNNNKIYLGSVFVSGVSLNDTLFYSEAEQRSHDVLPIYFFKHKDSLTDVAHLLNWPRAVWLTEKNNFPRTSLRLERVGRTHVIAEHGYKFYPVPRYDPVTKESVYKRTPKDSYKDWQDPDLRLLSFGHFEFEGKHDLFRLNLIKKISDSFDNGDDLAQFIISEFFVLLGGYTRNQLTARGQKYFPRIKDRLETFKREDMVLFAAYPNNANSSFIIDKIRECIKPEITNRIFSLMPINRERIGASLLISPLVFEPIREILKHDGQDGRSTNGGDTKNKKALLFDSTVITGRTRKELKHLLIALGASEVKTLTIADRLRLPFKVPDKSKHLGYWRLDLPRLGAIESCPLCKVLNDVLRFKGDLSSAFAQERIDHWINGWKVVSHFNPLPNGITPTAIEPISKNLGIEFDEELGQHKQIISEKDRIAGFDNKIQITNSMGLSIYATELHSVTSKDDIALSLCRKNPLPAKARIELLASQFLMFPNEHSSLNHYEMALDLFAALNSRNFVDNHSALAAMVLINQPQKLHEKMILFIFSKAQPTLAIRNIDVEIVLAFILKNSVSGSARLADKVLSLLKYKDDNSTLSKLKQFHSEIYSEFGKIHARPLITFFLKKDSIEPHIRVRQLHNSLSKMIYLLNEITEFRKRAFGQYYDEAFKTECFTALQYACDVSKVILDKYVKAEHSFNEEDFNFRMKQLEINIEHVVVKKLKALHSFLFCHVVEDEEFPTRHPVKDELSAIISSMPKNAWEEEASKKEKRLFLADPPIVKISNTVSDFKNILTLGRSNAWVIIDDLIEDEILYFTSNAIHATQLIPNFWSYNNHQETAHMWISVVYEERFVVLNFLNASDEIAPHIKEMILKKKKRGIIHLLEELKGEFEVEQLQYPDYHNLIKVVIKIPII